LVITHTPRSTSLEEGKGLRFRQQIELWQTQLADSGLGLAIENKAIRHPRDRCYVLTPLDRLRDFADRYNLGLVLDTSHAGTANADLLRARRTFDGRLANVHLSDTGGSVPLAANRTVRKALEQHRFPGDGDLSLVDLMADLANCGYTGPVTLEISPLAMDIWWPPSVRRRLTEAITWMKQATSSRSLVTG
jgi:sugar phosphate isomerase/epimerase